MRNQRFSDTDPVLYGYTVFAVILTALVLLVVHAGLLDGF